MRLAPWLLVALAGAACTVQVNNPEVGSNNRINAHGAVDVAVQPGAGPNGRSPQQGGALALPAGSTSPSGSSPGSAPSSGVRSPDNGSQQESPGAEPSKASAGEPTPGGEFSPVVDASPLHQVGASPSSEPTAAPGPSSPVNPSPLASPVPDGSAASPDPRYRPPAFITVKSVAARSPIEVIDFGTLVVANGTSISITSDAGASWTDYTLLRPLKAMSWVDAAHGWAITDQYAIWRLTITDGHLDVEVLDPIRGGSPFQVHFVDLQHGFIATSASNGSMMSTSDGGRTWANGIAVGEVNAAAKFYGRGNRFSYVNGWDQLYMKQPGGFARVQPPNITAVGQVEFADGITAVGSRNRNAIAISTDDVSFTAVKRDIRTSTQVLTGWLAEVFPISDDVWVGQGAYHLSLTRDGGRTWMEPSPERHTFKWLRPFSETQMWGATDDTYNLTLYRAGRK